MSILVLDIETKTPLIGVNIYIKSTQTGTTTDLDGNYKIINLEPGTYKIIYRYLGYKTKTIEVTVVANRTVINDVKLEEDNNVSIDYDIVYSLIPPAEINEEEFNQVLSFIIQDILVKAMNAHEDRIRNSAESNQ